MPIERVNLSRFKPNQFHPFSIDLSVLFQAPLASIKELTARHQEELESHVKHRSDTNQYTKDSRHTEMRQQLQDVFCECVIQGCLKVVKVPQMDNGKCTNHNRCNPVQ